MKISDFTVNTETCKTLTERYDIDFRGRKGYMLQSDSNTSKDHIVFEDWEIDLTDRSYSLFTGENYGVKLFEVSSVLYTKGDDWAVRDRDFILFNSLEVLEWYLSELKRRFTSERHFYKTLKEQVISKTADLAYQNGSPITFDDLVIEEEMLKHVRNYCETVFGDEPAKSFTGGSLAKKAGFLLSGPPGNGKTSLAKAIVNEYKTSLVWVSGFITTETLEAVIKQCSNLKKKVILFEEMDNLLRGNNDDMKGKLLSLLDGGGDVDSTIFIATTNYPDQLDRAFTQRPGRFSLNLEFSSPTSEQRRTFFTERLPDATTSFINEVVDVSEGFSFDFCREVLQRASMTFYIEKLPMEESVREALQEIKSEFGSELNERVAGGFSTMAK